MTSPPIPAPYITSNCSTISPLRRDKPYLVSKSILEIAAGDADRLGETAKRILYNNRDFQRLVRDLGRMSFGSNQNRTALRRPGPAVVDHRSSGIANRLRAKREEQHDHGV